MRDYRHIRNFNCKNEIDYNMKNGNDNNYNLEINPYLGLPDDEEIDKILAELEDWDDEAEETSPAVLDSKPTKPEAPTLGIEDNLKRIAKINMGVNAGRFSSKELEEFEQINHTLTIQGLEPARRGFWKAKNNVEYKHEPHKARYGKAVQKADIQWLWEHYREMVNGLCDHACDPISELFSKDEWSGELAEKIATLQGNEDYTTGKAKHLTAERKCILLGLPENLQRQLAVIFSSAIKKEKRRESVTNKSVTKKALQQQEKERLFETKAIDVSDKIDAYKKAKPLRNNAHPETQELVNVWKAINQAGGDSRKLVKVLEEYKNLTGIEMKKPTLQRRITFLKGASILKTYRV